MFSELSGPYTGGERAVIAPSEAVITGIESTYTNYNNVPLLIGVRPLFTPTLDVLKAVGTDGPPLPAEPLPASADGANALGGTSGENIITRRTFAPRGHVCTAIKVITDGSVESLQLHFVPIAKEGLTADSFSRGVDSEWIGRAPQPDDATKRPSSRMTQLSVAGETPGGGTPRPIVGLFGTGGAGAVMTIGVVGRGSPMQIRRGTVSPFGMADSLRGARDAFPHADAVRQRPDADLKAALSGRTPQLPASAAAVELAGRAIERGDDTSLVEARRLVQLAAADVNAPSDVQRLAACILANGVGGPADPDGAATMTSRVAKVLDEAAIGFLNAHRQDLLWEAAKFQQKIEDAHAMPVGSLMRVQGRLAAADATVKQLRRSTLNAPAEPKMALEGGNLGFDGRLIEILCRSKGKGFYRVLASRAVEPKYVYRTKIENGPPVGPGRVHGYIARVTLQNVGVQPLHKVTFTATNPREAAETDLQRKWHSTGSADTVMPGKAVEIILPIDGYDFGRNGERLPDVNISVAVEW